MFLLFKARPSSLQLEYGLFLENTPREDRNPYQVSCGAPLGLPCPPWAENQKNEAEIYTHLTSRSYPF